MAAGDAVLGLNPVDDTVESVRRVLDAVRRGAATAGGIPTQICVLAHVTTQMRGGTTGARPAI